MNNIKINEFSKLPEIDMHDNINNLKSNDLFLMGESIIKQKVTKSINDEVTVYIVIHNKGTGSFSYYPKILKLIE